MADISAITALDGVTYSIKDSEARGHLVPSAGTTGQVLTKTASGYGWEDASGGGNVDTVNGISPDANKNVQTLVEITQAQYDALVSPDPNVEYFITDGSVSYPTADDMRYQEGVSVADALDTLNAGLVTFYTGSYRFTNVTQNTDVRTTITFSTPMPSADYGIALTCYAGDANWATVAMRTTSRTANGFEIMLWNNGATCPAFTVGWVAIYQGN